jgi:hypothetical protein
MNKRFDELANAELVRNLRGFGQMMPEGGPSDPLIEIMASIADEAADAIEAAEAKAKRFRDLLMSRPANNAALPQSYVEWSSRMYLVDGDGFLREPEELLAAMTRRAAD